MFYWLVIFFMFLGGLVYWHSVKTAKHAREEKLKLIRQKIEVNEKKKLMKKLDKRPVELQDKAKKQRIKSCDKLDEYSI